MSEENKPRGFTPELSWFTVVESTAYYYGCLIHQFLVIESFFVNETTFES